MSPRAILFDLDDTILQGTYARMRYGSSVAEEFAADLLPLTPARLAQAIATFARDFWADADRHREWTAAADRRAARDRRRRAHQPGRIGSRRAFHRKSAAGSADRFSARREAELCLFPDAHAVIDALRQAASCSPSSPMVQPTCNAPRSIASIWQSAFRSHPDRRRAWLRQTRGARVSSCHERAGRCSGADLDGGRQSRVGGCRTATPRHPRDLVRSGRRGRAAGSPARPDRIISSLSELLQAAAPGSAD